MTRTFATKLAGLPPPSSPPHVKVCGIRRAEDGLAALESGATFLGLIFARESPRCLSAEEADQLLIRLRQNAPDVRPVGVFVSESAQTVAALVARLRLCAVQLHGDPTDAGWEQLTVPMVRAIRVRGPESLGGIRAAGSLGPVLLDAYAPDRAGGTGKTFDHALALPHLAAAPTFIAGGLNPDNIASISGAFRHAGPPFPYAFDVSSGLEESPGIKDHAKIRAFFRAYREAWAPND